MFKSLMLSLLCFTSVQPNYMQQVQQVIENYQISIHEIDQMIANVDRMLDMDNVKTDIGLWGCLMQRKTELELAKALIMDIFEPCEDLLNK